MKKPDSAVIYAGPSELDGEPIIVVATGIRRPSKNPKTGPMIQLWILRADVDPYTASLNGADASVCGDCPHRTQIVNGKQERVCYVNTFHAPRSIYGAYIEGQYPEYSTYDQIVDLFAGRAVRLGAYGDPAAVPFHVLATITKHAKTITGYTHQWRTADPRLQSLVMASVDSPAEHGTATANGWRTFRTRSAVEPLQPHEITCPASPEAGKRTTCIQCGLCNGAQSADDRRRNIAIIAHGSGAKVFDRRIIPLQLLAA